MQCVAGQRHRKQSAHPRAWRSSTWFSSCGLYQTCLLEFIYYMRRYRHCAIYIHAAIILPLVLYGCETWSLSLREAHALRVSENKLFRKKFGPNRGGGGGEEEGHISEDFVMYMRRLLLFGWSSSSDGKKMLIEFWYRSLLESVRLSDREVNGWITLIWILRR